MQYEKRYMNPGETVRLELPYSEVCMHMQVAGKVMDVELLDRQYPMAQLYNDDGSPYSAPITTGEAGFYSEGDRYYCYPVPTGEAPPVRWNSERPAPMIDWDFRIVGALAAEASRDVHERLVAPAISYEVIAEAEGANWPKWAELAAQSRGAFRQGYYQEAK